ncbi:MAG: pyridoxal-dependent decarboxylase [Piptocephalis tieghemiana]|nr:MAG: pyridoxal-dependent decarboxylase [Piptocephalis tieghemiana]
MASGGVHSVPFPSPFPSPKEEYASLPEVRSLRVDEATLAKLEEGQEDAFFIANLDVLVQQHHLWRQCLPRVTPFYAVKCNPDPWVLRILAALGTGFDCASRSEFLQVLEAGVSPDRIIYANPCKQASHLRAAASANVRLLTFDNADELDKLARLHPHAQCVLRIRVDDSKSICQLGAKFGASPDRAESLLRHASTLGLEVVGVSFHVGSGCTDPHAYVEAVSLARHIFDLASSLGLGHSMRLLDVGGGFSDQDQDSPSQNSSLKSSTICPSPPRRNIQIIGEPGRFYVERAFTLAVSIVARRRSAHEEDDSHGNPSPPPPPPPPPHQSGGEDAQVDDPQHHRMYYVNDGVYGSFNCTLFDHAIVHPRPLMRQGLFHGHHWMNLPSHLDTNDLLDEDGTPCSIWGPTCDGIDRINPMVHHLPPLDVGDWLGYANMGAYTICAASRFNGFSTPEVIYVGKDMQALITSSNLSTLTRSAS